jgi:hypothetical protein
MAAGGSARREYERRLAAHRTRVRRTIPALLLVLAIAVPVAALAAEANLPGTGPWVALMATIGIARALWPDRSRVDRWSKGANGEEKVARALEALAPGYFVLHDRGIPGSKANIDHVVVGPPGVFIVETKNVAGRVTVEGGRLRVAGREKGYVEQAWREAVAVQSAAAETFASLGIDVKPLLCFTRDGLPRKATSAEGVPLLSPRGVVSTIRSMPSRLDPEQVAALHELLDRSLRAA